VGYAALCVRHRAPAWSLFTDLGGSDVTRWFSRCEPCEFLAIASRATCKPDARVVCRSAYLVLMIFSSYRDGSRPHHLGKRAGSDWYRIKSLIPNYTASFAHMVCRRGKLGH
jgi:hypothetical protein